MVRVVSSANSKRPLALPWPLNRRPSHRVTANSWLEVLSSLGIEPLESRNPSPSSPLLAALPTLCPFESSVESKHFDKSVSRKNLVEIHIPHGPEIRAWIKDDSDVRAYMTSLDDGPVWDQVARRVTIDADAFERSDGDTALSNGSGHAPLANCPKDIYTSPIHLKPMNRNCSDTVTCVPGIADRSKGVAPKATGSKIVASCTNEVH